ncbi:MAG: hypothetical protein Kow0069_15250 [Promethearchaeota archaeon]
MLRFTKEDLDPFFSPKSVVLVGASRNTFTFSGMILKNLLELRYEGTIHVVNPNAEEVHGLPSSPTVSALPEVPDLAIIVTRHDLLACFEALGRFGVRRVMIEVDLPAEVLDQLLPRLRKVVERYQMIVFGPSMIGVINYHARFSSSIIPTRIHIIEKNRGARKTPGLSFIAQSGGLAGGLGWWSPSQSLPISKVVHLGGSCDAAEHDVLRYLFEDPDTHVISLFLKDVTPELVEVVRLYRGVKPVLFKTVACSRDPPRKANAEALERAGAIRVRDYIELFEFGKLFLWSPLPRGNRLGVIGPSSGAISLVTEAMEENDLRLAETAAPKETSVSGGEPATPAVENPVDFWPPTEFVGTKVCKVYHAASRALLAHEEVDGLILALEFFSEIEFDFAVFSSIQREFPDKPIVAVLIHAERDGAKRIVKCSTHLKIPVFEDEVERAVRGYKALLDFSRLQGA